MTVSAIKKDRLAEIEAEATKQVLEESTVKAKTALVLALRERAAAAAVLAGVDRKIEDIKAQIADGTL